MLLLTRLFLHNWHRFNHNILEVDNGLYLTGHNGSGKSSILDAIQLVLIADLQQVHFNSSVQQDRSARSLDTYVRGKVGEQRWLRPGNTVAYIALEFRDQDNAVTLGVCIEAGEGKSPEKMFFILAEALDENIFVVNGRELTRRELRKSLHARRGARYFDAVGEYQDEMLNRLGGLNARFRDLFLRALTFQPIRNIPEFVERWLLEAQPLSVENLHAIRERLGDLDRQRQQVETRLDELKVIVNHQSEVKRWRQNFAEYALLAAMLRVLEKERDLAKLDTEIAQRQKQIEQGEREQNEIAATLKNARAELDEARLQLRQSDVARRQREFNEELGRSRAQADAIRAQWNSLRRDLTREANAIESLIACALLETDEQETIRILLTTVAALTPDAPPPDSLAVQIEDAVRALDTGSSRADKQKFEIEQTIEKLKARGKQLEKELGHLRAQRSLFPFEVERLRDLLEPILGSRPPLLCERIEIRDERWQDAVEAMLGPRRFNILVPPEHFDAALRALDEARAKEKLYDAALLDLAKARTESRAALPGSLAEQIIAPPELRGYVDTILGDTMMCESVGELRAHRKAITSQVVVYREWTVRAIPPRNFQPWFVGKRAQASQIASREKELAELGEQLATLAPRAIEIQTQVEQFKHGRAWSNLRQRLDAPLDERPIRSQIADLEMELRGLDTSGIRALELTVQRYAEIVARESEKEKTVIAQVARWQTEKTRFQDERLVAQRELTERVQQANERRDQYPQAIQRAEEMFLAKQDSDLIEAIRNTESAGKGFETRAAKELDLLIGAGATYNTRYAFAADPSQVENARYADEHARLNATDLPKYKADIEKARREADQELREHVLHKLREQIQNAKQKLDQINVALSIVDFHGEKYRFTHQAAESTNEFYRLIHNAQTLGSGPLFESEFYQNNKEAFDRFYEALTRTPNSDEERAEQERLADYRGYLTYDILVTHPDGQQSRWSKIMDQTSGGETQTPFYLTIAASFVQLYRINERSGRPTIRLVAFDEAFSKMDQSRIASTLDLFQRFKLQVITATPLERCEYLAPKICTTYVLANVGDHVIIEPYRVYAAKLDEANAE